MEPVLKIEHLFHHSRFPKGLALFFLPFYIPLGLVVMVIRFFFALQLYIVLLVLPKTWLVRRILLRISGSLIGIFVTQEGLENYDGEECKMIVSNHITHLDKLAFESLIPCVMDPEKNHTPGLMRWILKYDDIKPDEQFPALVFAEGSTTSGSKGLLKFSSWPFDSKNEPFLLALLTISRPYFVQIAPSVLGSYWWSDFLWLLFSPYTHFKIRFIQPPEREDGQTNEEYSITNQKFMATELGLTATKFDAKEKAEYAKRLLHEQVGLVREATIINTSQTMPKAGPSAPNNTNQSSSHGQSKVESMASKVKDVLPQVPLKVIQDDLKKTKCIDTTISNILEGKVPYTQESSTQANQPKIQAEAPYVTKVAAKSFGQNSAERHLSFQERKKAFIEAARQKYIAKHNLQMN